MDVLGDEAAWGHYRCAGGLCWSRSGDRRTCGRKHNARSARGHGTYGAQGVTDDGGRPRTSWLGTTAFEVVSSEDSCWMN